MSARLRGVDKVLVSAADNGWTVLADTALRMAGRKIELQRGEVHVDIWTTRTGGVSLVSVYRRMSGGMRSYRDLPREPVGQNKAAQTVAILEGNWK